MNEQWTDDGVREYIRNEPREFQKALLIATTSVVTHIGAVNAILCELCDQSPDDREISPPSLTLTETDVENLRESIQCIEKVMNRLEKQMVIISEELG